MYRGDPGRSRWLSIGLRTSDLQQPMPAGVRVNPCPLNCAMHAKTAYHLAHGHWEALQANRQVILALARNLWRRHCRCDLANRVWTALKERGYDGTH